MCPLLASSTLPTSFTEDVTRSLEELRKSGLLREEMPIDAIDGVNIRLKGKNVVNWASNDYLGLSTHPVLVKAASESMLEWGLGARASRLLTGTTSVHVRLESKLAEWFNTEAALVYSSGYLANAGVLTTILDENTTVLIDRLSHASLIDAARASHASFKVFRHNDVEQVKSLLNKIKGRCVIVTEGVFSMDGDRALLKELSIVANEYDAILYVDDAHGTFVLGNSGRGAIEAAGIGFNNVIYVATMGKALGLQGGFVVGERVFIDYLRTQARTYIYSTALATPLAAAACAALDLLDASPQYREVLAKNVLLLDKLLRESGLGPSVNTTTQGEDRAPSHIVPIVIGQSLDAVSVARIMWERGCWTPAIRPPTVAQNSARLRLSVSSNHSEDNIRDLVSALSDAINSDK